jgi:adenosylhomocysteine nucleosidase
MPKIAIIAAMEREVEPLIRNWKVRTLYQSGHAPPRYRLFEKGSAVVICGGMGAGAARRATATVISEFAPSRVLSVGFAGALDQTLKVGDVFEPRIVINAKDGSRADTGSGEKALVSYAFVAGKGQKNNLREAYGASAVDMEAAAVAQGAQAAGVQFAALKAISDAADSDMPPMGEFIGDNGEFYRSRFVLYLAARPRLWGMTLALARNSAKASRALCGAISRYLERERVNLYGG